jgi:nicotinate-nucleotide pyrophosphorylase (carboxylating)
MSEDRVPVPDAGLVLPIVKAALEEDGAHRDLTTQALIPPEQRGAAMIVAKQEGVLCGLPVAALVFATLNRDIDFEVRVPEGAAVSSGELLARIDGALAPILSAERVALNFLQQLSGVATATRGLVDAVADVPANQTPRIVDSRKTTPGLRALQRYAVRVGGGRNHRFNLSDGILVKDNHLVAARARGLSVAGVVEQARLAAPHTLRVEIEVTTAEEAQEALEGGADVILLDNMPVEEMRQVVQAARGRALTEASGGVTLENVHAIAEAGVDVISVGAITHSAPALDISLELEG